MPVLPIFASLEPAESLHGYLLRRAQLVGYSSVSWLLKLARENMTSPAGRDLSDHLPGLAQLLEVPETQLASSAILRSQKGSRAIVRLFGRYDLRLEFVRRGVCAVCPSCLDEGRVIHRLWELQPVTDCPHHQVELIDRCPQCHQKIRWDRSRLRSCHRCGGDFAARAAVSSDSAVVSMVAQIFRAFGESVAPPAASGFDNFPFARDPALLLSSIAFLARADAKAAGRSDQQSSDLAAWRARLKVASGILAPDWQAGFSRLMQAFERAVAPSGQVNLAKMYPWLYRSLYSERGDGAREMLRTEFARQFECQHGGLIPRLSRQNEIFQLFAGSDSFVTFSEACTELALTGPAMNRLADAANVAFIGADQRGRGRCRRIPRSDLAKLKDELARHPGKWRPPGSAKFASHKSIARQAFDKSGVSLLDLLAWFDDGGSFPSERVLDVMPDGVILDATHLSRRLGVTEETIGVMLRGGFFGRFETAKSDERIVAGRLRAGTYARFEASLVGALRAARDTADGIPLLDALNHRVKRYGTTLGLLLSEVIEGQIRYVGQDASASGLNRVLLSEADLAAYEQPFKEVTIPGLVSALGACQLLGLEDSRVLTALVRQNRLREANPGRGATERRMFRMEDLVLFKQRYIRISEIVEQGIVPRVHNSHRSVRKWLARQKVVPRMGPEIDGVPVFYFERESVLRVVPPR